MLKLISLILTSVLIGAMITPLLAPAQAGTPVIGASCPFSGLNGITAANVPVTCTQQAGGGALVWTSFVAVTSGSANAIVNNPSGSNQTITPGDTTSVPLTIQGAASTSVDLFDVKTNGGGVGLSVNNTASTISTIATTMNLASAGGNANITIAAGSNLGLGGGGSGAVNLKSTGSIGLGVGVVSPGLHIFLNAANNDIAGKLTCASSTVTKTFNTAYVSTPVVIVFDETTKGGANLTAISNTAFTVSCTGATDVLDYIVFGNNA